MNIVRQVLYSPLYTEVCTSARKFFDAGDSIFERHVQPLPNRVEESDSEDEEWEDEDEEEEEEVYSSSWDVFLEGVPLESEEEEQEDEDGEEESSLSFEDLFDE